MIARLKRWYTRTGVLAREIVLRRVVISTTVGTVLGILVSADVIPTSWSDVTTRYVGLALTLLGVLVGAARARSGSTPAEPALKPTAIDGTPLVPYDAQHDIEE